MFAWWLIFIGTFLLFVVLVLVAKLQAIHKSEIQEACEPPAGLAPSPSPSPSPSPAPSSCTLLSLTSTLANMSVESPPTHSGTGTDPVTEAAAQPDQPMDTEKDKETKQEQVTEEKQKQNNSGKKRRLESPAPSSDDKPLSPIPASAVSKSTRSPVTGSPTTTTSSRHGQGQVQAEQEREEHKPGEYLTSSVFFKKLILHEKAETFAIGGKPETTPIWICNRDDKVIEVFQGLIKRNILSVPVLLKKNSKYYGFLDLMDIVRYVVAHFGSSRFQQDKAFFELVEEEQHFKEKTVDDLMTYPLSNRNPFQPVVAGYSAFSVIELMAREQNLHRVPVINSHTSRQLLNLITQSQCIRYLKENLHMIGDKGSKPVSACVYTPSVLSVSEDTPAIDAFNMMVTKQVQGLAIVTEEGRLRGNLSLRDLKLIGSDAALFWRLHQTVKNFVLKLRSEWQKIHGRPRSVVYVIPTATLEEVIQTLADHDIHRIYVCDSHAAKKPIGVIALRDVLLELIS